ncbi:hypothetical protein GDI2871 [Gluconacetobacter diazotrophicus PA1 5]|uniref:Uncharacterized protein n=1 Tax=Gluconacetobacter diazotrophicus (strain ATCC 49037 / DSM 5601 / CCUG 37298 / CIP 103539 / LMG 7603 / PAl5) TaxID=272568 RepID=A9HQZ0_GLUDA|nr:hypothetical protein GDI2871 [Gluconacetobacter diazotrophicus PA1 5]
MAPQFGAGPCRLDAVGVVDEDAPCPKESSTPGDGFRAMECGSGSVDDAAPCHPDPIEMARRTA